jgi:hypothetical protein
MNNDKQEQNIIAKRNDAINQFLDEMENKNHNLKKINKDEEEESDDPFLRVEKEYLSKNINNSSKKETKLDKSKKNGLSNYKRNNKNENEKSYDINNVKLKEKKLYENLVFNHFKKEEDPRNYKLFSKYFSPKIRKNPGRIYMKNIQNLKLNNLKMKSFNKRIDTFNSHDYNNNYYKTHYNFYPKYKKDYSNNFNSLDKFKNTNYSFLNSTHSNFRVRVLNYNDYLDYNHKKSKNKIIKSSNSNNKKLLYNSYNKNEDKFFYTSLTINKAKTEDNKKEEKDKNINIKNQKEINKEIEEPVDHKVINKNNRGYFSENRRHNLNKAKNNLIFQTKMYISDKNSMKNILHSMNDPSNPYSISFSTFVLQKYYNLDFHFNKFELGVPLLRFKKFNTSKTRPSYFPNNKYRVGKTNYDNFYFGYKNYLTQQDVRKTNCNFYFKSNHSDKSVFKK